MIWDQKQMAAVNPASQASALPHSPAVPHDAVVQSAASHFPHLCIVPVDHRTPSSWDPATSLAVRAPPQCALCGTRQQPETLVWCVHCGDGVHAGCWDASHASTAAATSLAMHSRFHCGCPMPCLGCQRDVVALDPAKLTCLNCHFTFHAYCVRPSLKRVPLGPWRCPSCVHCTHCGRTTPGDAADAEWQVDLDVGEWVGVVCVCGEFVCA